MYVENKYWKESNGCQLSLIFIKYQTFSLLMHASKYMFSHTTILNLNQNLATPLQMSDSSDAPLGGIQVGNCTDLNYIFS